jgi:hypothetical protein
MKTSCPVLFKPRLVAVVGGLLCGLLNSSGAVPGDEHWDSQFGPVGANASLYAITVCGNKVYVGGFLTAAGNTRANSVAGFDGTNWFPLGNGLSPNNIAAVGLGNDGTNVYIGGPFTNADNSGATANAIWNGTSFSPLPGGGLSGVGLVFKSQGTNLYVGGGFTTAGTVTANSIAYWDGANWHPLGTGVSGCTNQFCFSQVFCLAFQGSDVYAGGNFVSAGGVSGSSHVARYDGSAWHALGSTITGPVSALIFYNGYLYAGGPFTNASVGITNIARWDGSSWSALPGGGANNQVTDFATDGTNLFVGGLFKQIGGIAANGIAKFNGSTWSALGSGVQGLQGIYLGQVNKMAWQSNQLYVVGSFERAGNAGASYVARWDGTNWWGLGGQKSKGMAYSSPNAVSCLLSTSNQLYAGGLFTAAGDGIVNSIGRWDGTNWNPLGNGVTGSFFTGGSVIVRGMAMIGTNLYAGGSFTNASGVIVNNIARWDGSNWWALGSGVDSTIRALMVANGTNLYAGGQFTNAGGIPSRGASMWDGTAWHSLNGGLSGSGTVNAFAYDGVSTIYAGGIFTTAGGVSATNIAKWNGSVWSPLGTGLNGFVSALAFTNGLLYVGGAFTTAGGVSANHIAVWNGTTWSALGAGVTGDSLAFVAGILVRGNNVYVNGNFTNAGGTFASDIAKWDGSQWSALGSGLIAPSAQSAMGLASMNNDLYVCGTFNFAGDKPSQFIARWNDQLNFYPPPYPQLTRSIWLTNGLFQFRLIGTSGESYILLGSTNLSVWTSLLTNSATLYDYTDPNTSQFLRRFYRAVLGP